MAEVTRTLREAGTRLHLRRRHLGLTPADVAALSGVPEATVRAVEEGDAPGLAWADVEAVLRAVGCRVVIEQPPTPSPQEGPAHTMAELVAISRKSWDPEWREGEGDG